MRLALVLVAMAACGGGSGDPDPVFVVDAPAWECWPPGPPMPEGTATLGRDRGGFVDLPEQMPLGYGPQGGFMVITHVRTTGLGPPGDVDNYYDPSNPFTRIRAFFDDTNIPVNRFTGECGVRTAYQDDGQGATILSAPVWVIFETCWLSEHLLGKRLRIELEVMDSAGRLATDTRVITAAPPEEEFPMQTGPGCL